MLLLVSRNPEMKSLMIISALLLAHHSNANIFRKLYRDHGQLLSPAVEADVGEPLILTPFIQNGSIEAGQQAALVPGEIFLNVTSYAGYFTVDDRFDSNIWFWYFPSADKPATDPIVLWLNGGPGATSLNGLFEENGPFIIDEDSNVNLREYSWHRNHSVIFIDNPVGVGFSFTNGGLARNETKVGADMYSALYQFFQLFPDQQQNEFYISGESYAGKYLPAIGYTIYKNNPSAEMKINLQGILIGDGWTDPVHQLNYGSYVYNVGIVGSKIKDDIDEERDKAIAAVDAADWESALNHWNSIMNLIEANSDVSVYNYVGDADSPGTWTSFLNGAEIRNAIHVGNTTFGDKGAGSALDEDMLQSIAPWVEELLENFRVIIYTGQLDIIVGHPMVNEYIKTLNFSGAAALETSSREIWYVNDEPAGYVRTGGNLIELLVRNAGHMVPTDQPVWAHDLLYRFTRNKPYA